MLERILVAIDGTDYSWRALEFAVHLAEKCGSSLAIMTVEKEDTDIAIFSGKDEDAPDQVGDEVLNAACTLMEGKGVECSYLLERGGKVADKIIAVEKMERCDAIVLGSRGLGVLEGLIKRSISQEVVENADVPVIVVK